MGTASTYIKDPTEDALLKIAVWGFLREIVPSLFGRWPRPGCWWVKTDVVT